MTLFYSSLFMKFSILTTIIALFFFIGPKIYIDCVYIGTISIFTKLL